MASASRDTARPTSKPWSRSLRSATNQRQQPSTPKGVTRLLLPAQFPCAGSNSRVTPFGVDGCCLWFVAERKLRLHGLLVGLAVSREADAMKSAQRFPCEHQELTRRHFLRVGAAGAAALGFCSVAAGADPQAPELAKAIETLEPYFTPQEQFRDVSRGKPLPHTLSDAKKREAGLTRETWKLEVVSDPEHPASIRRPLTKKDGSALGFDGLMKLAETHAVRFAKVMTCLNIGCPLGMGLWEGVPLRTLVWLTQPKENHRRVHYYGYHNDDPNQMFRSSLPVGRILEDYDDLPPVIVCYKLNGEWLTPERGA